jgi:sugar phosphate isomerase/epimerase
MSRRNNYPKLHNAAWPGVVGKGSPGAEPTIDLDTMLNYTAAAEVDGVKFDGFDLFLFDPHISIDATDDDLKKLADKASSRNLNIGSVVAPVWGGTGGGAALDAGDGRRSFLKQVQKGCDIARRLREMGIRPYGVVRIDSACGPTDWLKDPIGNQRHIADTFDMACDIADDAGEQLAAEGEVCWGGMHSWVAMVDLLERVGRPETLGFQADMAHTLMYLLGVNASEHRILPEGFDWKDQNTFDDAYEKLTDALRPWTIDFHIAQNDGTVHGSGTHDKTGKHCPVNDPNGKLDVVKRAGYWLRENGAPHQRYRHICWDGCMFPNTVMGDPKTWNDILGTMIKVRDTHGWHE